VPDRKEENQWKCDFSLDFISLLQTVFSKKFHISFFFETLECYKAFGEVFILTWLYHLPILRTTIIFIRPVVCIRRRIFRREAEEVISGWTVFQDENCAPLRYYAASSGNYLPTFRDNLSVPSSGVKTPKGSVWILGPSSGVKTPKGSFWILGPIFRGEDSKSFLLDPWSHLQGWRL